MKPMAMWSPPPIIIFIILPPLLPYFVNDYSFFDSKKKTIFSKYCYLTLVWKMKVKAFEIMFIEFLIQFLFLKNRDTPPSYVKMRNTTSGIWPNLSTSSRLQGILNDSILILIYPIIYLKPLYIKLSACLPRPLIPIHRGWGGGTGTIDALFPGLLIRGAKLKKDHYFIECIWDYS